MRVEDVTREQFARWSVERDVSVGCQRRGTTFSRLGSDERQLYLEEADEYFRLGPERWPLDILDRLDK